jgi:hypothetical protein
MVSEFSPNIRNLYSSSSSRNKSYNPILVTTSNVLSESQISFVCQEIENQRDANERGYNEDLMTDKVLPEFIIFLFCSKFQLSRVEALERLRVQDERRALFNHDDTQFF